MRDWPLAEKPCEKLLAHGPSRLSDAELLAVLIRQGQKERCAMTIARGLLNKFGSLRKLVSASKHSFCSVPGVGPVKFAQIQAAVEIVKRHYEEALKKETVFHSSDNVVRYLQCELRDKQHEVFGVLMLDSQHQLITFRPLFTGTINAAAVYPREIVKHVLADNAAAVILVHNHPSGVAEPSQADISVTNNVKSALALIDVSLLDHFIVGDTQTVSFAKRGLI